MQYMFKKSTVHVYKNHTKFCTKLIVVIIYGGGEMNGIKEWE